MSARSMRDPSPFRSGLVHSFLGAFTLTFVLGSTASVMHVFGTPDAASPSVRMALFEDAPDDAPQLNPRLPGYQEALGFAEAAPERLSTDIGNEPDLGVEYNAGQPVQAAAQQPAARQGIRINGQTVMPGQTFSQVTSNSTDAAAVLAVPSSSAVTAAVDDTPFARNARPFLNEAGKPTVSIIVGGLGINRTRTRAAINELPPEITLSFAPTAENLSSWVRDARRAGHEVLIELPMEPYDFGRQRPHPQVMQVDVSADTNKQRLARLLARTPGYFGVMNYQGDKFATEQAAMQPVLQDLRDKGLAFFEDGSLVRSEFTTVARATGVTFGKATRWIDERAEADEISQQLLLLESTARERGTALGTGMSFPVTLDILKDWLPTLDEKGIALAPASYYAKRSSASGQARQASLDPQG
ncbi:MAG: divergent polysaccharide deacetylase family protein [Pseudomonadota bacterium]